MTRNVSGVNKTVGPTKASNYPPVTRSSDLNVPEEATALSHEKIAARAKDIWQKKGCPKGQDQQNWQQAEEQLKAELRRNR
ncbi:MAG: DUF2934 domain-containing protein [Phycisphaerae bacterium]